MSRVPDPVEETGARARLLDAAEQLFGQRGIEGVSLREINAFAGQRNTGAIHYHFGSKDGLVAALMTDRLERIDRRRQALIDALDDLASCSAAALLRIMWQSMLDLCTAPDGHWLIQFHLSYHIKDASRSHPILNDPDRYVASRLLLDQLERRCPHLPIEQFRYRMGLVFMMFWAAVSRHDSDAEATERPWSTRFSLDETIKLAVAALAAPS